MSTRWRKEATRNDDDDDDMMMMVCQIVKKNTWLKINGIQLNVYTYIHSSFVHVCNGSYCPPAPDQVINSEMDVVKQDVARPAGENHTTQEGTRGPAPLSNTTAAPSSQAAQPHQAALSKKTEQEDALVPAKVSEEKKEAAAPVSSGKSAAAASPQQAGAAGKRSLEEGIDGIRSGCAVSEDLQPDQFKIRAVLPVPDFSSPDMEGKQVTNWVKDARGHEWRLMYYPFSNNVVKHGGNISVYLEINKDLPVSK